MLNPLVLAGIAWLVTLAAAVVAVRLGLRPIPLLAVMALPGLAGAVVELVQDDSQNGLAGGLVSFATYVLLYLALLLPSIALFSAVTAESKTRRILLTVRSDPGIRRDVLIARVGHGDFEADRTQRLQSSALMTIAGGRASPSRLGVLLLALTSTLDLIVGDRRTEHAP